MTASLTIRVAFGLTLAILVPACGDDSADDANAGATTTAPAAEASGAESVDIVGFEFEPGELTVAKGATVTFTNGDDFEHSAIAEDESFDTGTIAGAASAEVTFEEAGEFPYLCGIHNYMKGMIVVE